MMHWFSDTLSKRLFALMWLALVASHLAGFAAVHSLVAESGGILGSGSGLSTFPSLPPTPGVPAMRGADAVLRLPMQVLLLDYGVRMLVIALAAWWGSRWLAAPMRRLVAASGSLGSSVMVEAAPPVLDERRGTREVREAAHVFNVMARRLSAQFRARGLMVAAMSHDLRTPLTRLRLRIDGMDTDAIVQQRSADDIREMNELIDTVLGVFRGDALGSAEPLQDTSIGTLVQSLTDDLVEQGAQVQLSLPQGSDGAAVARAEPAALRRVVTNLLSNALRYAGAAEVSVQAAGKHVRIVIDDTGPGIAPAHLESVFEPFYRVDPSRNRHTGGTGLGLYIARELSQRQGALLSLANRPGGGLRAEICLPRA